LKSKACQITWMRLENRAGLQRGCSFEQEEWISRAKYCPCILTIKAEDSSSLVSPRWLMHILQCCSFVLDTGLHKPSPSFIKSQLCRGALPFLCSQKQSENNHEYCYGCNVKD
jgi:hypothetical protein